MTNYSILLIDSGSTKSDWVFLTGQEKVERNSVGMNPNFIREDGIEEAIKNSVTGIDVSNVSEIHFFGSGCAGVIQQKMIRDTFSRTFTNAKIFVDIDAMGSAIATCGDKPGISCILGTGCNSAYFDGKNIHPNNYGLGYILSDEGAGTWLGRKLITNYLYGLLPKNLSDSFSKEHPITRDEVINRIYNIPNANTWLASFTKFYSLHQSDPWVIKTISEGFDEFMHLFVMNYDDYQKLPVHFVGSISFTYHDILKNVALANKIMLGNVIQKPMDGLVEYFRSQ